MNRRGFLFGLGATIAIVPAASLMRIAPPPKLIVPPFKRWMSAHEFETAFDVATGPDISVVHRVVRRGGKWVIDLPPPSPAVLQLAKLVEEANLAVREATQLPPEMLGTHRLARRG